MREIFFLHITESERLSLWQFCHQWLHLRLSPQQLQLLAVYESVGWFSKKMPSYQYRKSHCGVRTILRLSYLHNGISYPGKIIYLYWIKPSMSILDWSSDGSVFILTNLQIQSSLLISTHCQVSGVGPLSLFSKWKKCHPGGHYWDHCPGSLSLIQITASHLILGLRPANERRRHLVMTSLIAWAQT